MRTLRERVLALAGLFQAARLVQQLAREGKTDTEAFRASTHSILMLDAASTDEVYGGAHGLALGLTFLRDKLTGQADPKDMEIAKYVIAMLQLETALRRRPEVTAAIQSGVQAADAQMAFFDNDGDDAVHPRLVEKLAELYTQTLSTLTPRIMVNGEQGYLATPLIAAKVRTALFAGIRSAVLWRQLGGSRWQLLLGRAKIAAQAAGILSSASAERTT